MKKYEGEAIQSSSNDGNIVSKTIEWLLSDKIFSYNLQYQYIISIIIIRNNSRKQFTSKYLTVKLILDEDMPRDSYLHNEFQCFLAVWKEWYYLKHKNYCLTGNTCSFFWNSTFQIVIHFNVISELNFNSIKEKWRLQSEKRKGSYRQYRSS